MGTGENQGPSFFVSIIIPVTSRGGEEETRPYLFVK
jgi:hypothetical protein